MSETYLKCACRACGGRIEFPAHAVGLSIGCPHCGATTDLYGSPASATAPPPLPQTAPPQGAQSSLVPQPPSGFAPGTGSRLQVATPPPPAPASEEQIAEQHDVAAPVARPVNWIGWTLGAVSVLLVVVGGLMYLNNAKQGKSVSSSPQSSRTAANTSSAAKPSNQEELEASADTAKTTVAAPVPKSVDDFKVSKITLQKTPGSSLVYAIGTLRNNSDVQRFGVRIELDLLDATGKKIGSTKDYVKVIEPHREWRFRALVLAQKTASVKLGKINEEE